MTTACALHVNGRFLTQPLSGVQRYALQLLGAFDALLAADPALAARMGAGAEGIPVWYPAGVTLTTTPPWRVLRPRPLAGRSGHAWEQMTLGRRVGRDYLVSLCGSGPLMVRNQLLVIHDANIWTIPEAFSKSYKLFHKTMRPLLVRRVTDLGTVSRFSAEELAQFLPVQSGRFWVIYNSAEHILAAEEDPGVLERHGLNPRGYLLAVGNQSPNKNIATAVAALEALPEGSPPLAVAGGFAPGVAQSALVESNRVKLLGRVSDAELKTLYGQAQAFVWPSRREGFGIPPLEAMYQGTPVLSSDRTAMPEVLGDAVLYFDPDSVDSLAACLGDFLSRDVEAQAALGAAGRARAAEFSWEASARRLIDLVASRLER